ncbi:MAG: nickel pincer cofactor biosynthesis protein LarC [Desulfobacula sp.]|nr:nickel pincer cofactor biosynthesis protein LarC [Desulfobacula sp.]
MILYADMFSGISGDMILGALVDIGTPVNWLTDQLAGVLNGFKIKTSVVYKNHLRAIDLSVDVVGEDASHRHYTDIKAMIKNSALSDMVKQQSLAAFKKIAGAEAGIHGKDIDNIHFHEVGAIDSLVDIIGTFLCIEYLEIDKVYASTISLGSGSVRCSHGVIPVPVPATMAILKDTPVKASDAGTEIVTPTGAAIIKTLTNDFGPMPDMTIKKIGYGSGKRDTGSKLPNLLRIVLGEKVSEEGLEKRAINRETIYVAKTNVDDMSPEVSGFLMETLFAKKALDVCYVPVQMKKNRPGLQIEVICHQQDLDSVIDVILTQTTSIGVRYHECERFFLTRENAVIDTAFGKVQVKKIINPDTSIRYVPEYEAAKKIATQKSIPLKDVYITILSGAALLDSQGERI